LHSEDVANKQTDPLLSLKSTKWELSSHKDITLNKKSQWDQSFETNTLTNLIHNSNNFNNLKEYKDSEINTPRN